MERAEIISQITAILEDVAEVSPEDVTESSVLMDDLDLSSMEILTIVASDKPFLLGSHEDPEIVKWFMQYKNA